MFAFFVVFCLLHPAAGDAATALDQALEGTPPELAGVQGAIDQVLSSFDDAAIPIFQAGREKWAVNRREQDEKIAESQARISARQAAQGDNDDALAKLRNSASLQMAISKADEKRDEALALEEALQAGLLKLIEGLGAAAQMGAVEPLLAGFQHEHEHKKKLDTEHAKAKGKLAETLSLLRRSKEAGKEDLRSERASMEARVGSLEDELERSSSVQEACIAGIRALLQTVASGDQKNILKTIDAKIGKKSTSEDRFVFLNLYARLGLTEAPDALQKMYKAAEKEIKAIDKELEKERSAYEKVIAAYAGETKGRTDGKVSMRAANALKDAIKKLGEISARQNLQKLLHHNSCMALGHAIASLDEGKPKTKKIDWLISTAAKERNQDTRSSLVEAMGNCDTPKVRETLRNLLTDKDVKIQIAALESLVNLKDEESMDRVRSDLLHHENWKMRAAAVDAMVRIPQKESVPSLIESLETETGRLREDALAALQNLTHQQISLNAVLWRQWWRKSGDLFEIGLGPTERKIHVATPDPERGGTSFYGIQTESERVCFVLDVSGSMKEDAGSGNKTKIEVAKAELKNAIMSLEDHDSFAILVYADECWKWRKGMTPAESSNKDRAVNWVENEMEMGQATDIYLGLTEALKLAGMGATDPAYRSGIDTLYFMSDGQPTVGEVTDPEEIRTRVREFNRLSRIKIHTISVGHEANVELLYGLAEDSGGSFVKR